MRTAARVAWGVAFVLGGGGLLLPASRAWAANVTIAAGAEYTLTADIVLGGTDTFTAGDPNGPRCTIHGAGFSIHDDGTGTWTGNFEMNNCDVDGMGATGATAISLTSSADVTISGSTFATSSEILLTLSGAASVTFRGNTIAASSTVVNVMTSADNSQDVFHVHGNSTGTKVFSGNTILKARLGFENTNGWLIGGDTPADSNILIGERTGIGIQASGSMMIRGNYSHTMGTGGNQVKNFNVVSGGDIVAEHNVFIESDWNIIDNGQGEIRYNLIVNPVQRGWIIVWSTGGTMVHHNVLIQTVDDQSPTIASGFVIYQDDDPTVAAMPPTTEVYNNTFDAGGVCTPGPAGAVTMAAILASLRSNAFLNIRLPPGAGPALVGTSPAGLMNPLPIALGYTDYNLFYNPDPSVQDNYGVGVAGKTLRVDPGFGYHDVPVGGAMNAQVDPKFANPAPHKFPYLEADVIARKVTVCQILAYYRRAYTPGANSPLIDAGDPQEGPGNDIGAVGAGMDNPLDLFGKLCDPTDIGTLSTAADISTCTAVNRGGGSGVTPGGPTGPLNHGFTCVCDVGPEASATLGLGPVTLLTALALLRRRRR